MCLTQQSALVIVLTMHGLGLGYRIHHRAAAIHYFDANRFLLFYYYSTTIIGHNFEYQSFLQPWGESHVSEFFMEQLVEENYLHIHDHQ